jgi:hypothetical protein
MPIEPPGNPKGWGDPSPIVLIVLLLVFLGAWLSSTSTPITLRQCQELFRNNNIPIQ